VKTLLFAVLIALTSICLSHAAEVSKPWETLFFTAPGADVQKAAADINPADTDVVILFEESFYKYDPDGKLQTTDRTVYKILNESAIQDWSITEQEYSPWYQKRPEIRARVITPDGATHELDPRTIDDGPAKDYYPDLYTDNRIVQAPLPAVAAGSIVEDEIAVAETAPFFPGGTVERFFFEIGRAHV